MMVNGKLGQSEKPGTFLITVDLEMMWGFKRELMENPNIVRDEKFKKYTNSMLKTREVIAHLLNTLDKYQIPVTWAIVGCLLLDDHKGESDIKCTPPLKHKKDQFLLEKYAHIKNSLWHGKDIVEKILQSDINHEIACHSYSHEDFSACCSKVALLEIRKCRALIREMGIEPKSFVFPEDKVGHLDLLCNEGFRFFRGPIPDALQSTRRIPYISTGLYLSKYRFTRIFSIPPPIVYPNLQSGLWNIPGCMVFHERADIGWESQFILKRAVQGVERASIYGKMFHLYLHDHNLTQNSNIVLALEKLLRHVNRLRERKLIKIVTMGKPSS